MYPRDHHTHSPYAEPSHQRLYAPHLRTYSPPSNASYDRRYMEYPQAASMRLPEMTRIDTQYPRREDPPPSALPLSATSPDSESSSPQPARPKKARREKPHIELAPDQPPTTQGKPRARVYVACLQCRTRKIRCDGAKPVCHNCSKRTGNNECTFDALPKRRGPDKNPGARQRIPRKSGEPAPPRRRRTSTAVSPTVEAASEPIQLPPFSFPSPTSSSEHTHSPEEYNASYARTCACHGLALCPSVRVSHVHPSPQISAPHESALKLSLVTPREKPARAYITEYGDNNDPYPLHAYSKPHSPRKDPSYPTIASEPSVQFSRKIWWDKLLSLYASSPGNLSDSQRALASQQVKEDIRFLFRNCNSWFSWLHTPTFFFNFLDPARRECMQPSLVYALLAVAIFWKSSEIGLGRRGRELALLLREEAQSALEASYNAGRVDETLAQAAWILAMFEISTHPHFTSDRTASSMVMLDSLIRALSLTAVDKNDPNTSTFSPGQVPEVASTPHRLVRSMHNPHDYAYSQASVVSNDRGCSCQSLTLQAQRPQTIEHTPLWAQTPAWSSEWSESEINKESCRRLCWSAMTLVAGHSNYQYACKRDKNLDLFITDPSNYALLFSGEAVTHSPAAKDTIWALHDRAFLLWHACVKMRHDTKAAMPTKGQFAIKAWHEADAIEEAFNRHTCSIERAYIFQGREYLFNTRMCITYEFQRFVPLVSNNSYRLFDRRKAEEWLAHQSVVAQKFTLGLHTVTGLINNDLAMRPFFVLWFMAQVSRCLALWHTDNSLFVALDVCKNLLPGIDFLTALWPCDEQRHRYAEIRERLNHACLLAQVSPPPPMNLALPSRPAYV
uniref:Zn(2)-C6 fungal-type domain-containing protein n=1 Tax=Mycena chlorophos TaxID=658473 RepID=A0ABQ0MA11_MYCCL|nr:predicted protein [Mycena chlorophos]